MIGNNFPYPVPRILSTTNVSTTKFIGYVNETLLHSSLNLIFMQSLGEVFSNKIIFIFRP